MLRANVPAAPGIGQFGLPVFALVEKANSGVLPVPVGPKQQLPERRQGPSRHDVGLGGRRGLQASYDYFRLLCQGHTSAGLAQESGFPRVRFDQDDIEIGAGGCHDQPGETSPAAEIRQGPRACRDVGQELRRIEDMAAPNVVDRSRPDQVDGLLPFQENFNIGLQLPLCFT